ncbi:nuclear transport factor 2 family protein [Acinetobacter sp. ME22]|uniref:nuclear transport factor 2 family protein n=1 Tax=Acinetobacter sp. ME22 TaxID=2904802 RepID=UPI001EDA9C3B|nr:nuclear transport factor 2 family protein [Acinetobacter sp. ME22]MCG2575120.1 nuclear transport factor 2 family protein [Acinetobacter sp. ME22]
MCITSLNTKLELLQKLWKKKDIQAIFDQLYTDKTEISGQGTTNLFTGKDALTMLLQELVEGSSAVNLSIFKSTELNNQLILTWVNWTVYTDDKNSYFTMKSLFLWQEINQDWKIIADMYADEAIVS